ncbi:MAG TPA: hypothetical protein VNN73_08025 [Blastocatellia bacterium]|nr:hypothetical protein [Blastocatellia bacterium]
MLCEGVNLDAGFAVAITKAGNLFTNQRGGLQLSLVTRNQY